MAGSGRIFYAVLDSFPDGVPAGAGLDLNGYRSALYCYAYYLVFQVEKVIAFVVSWIPLAVHLVDDREGDTKKGNDIIVLSIITGVLAIVCNVLLGIPYFEFAASAAGIHVLLFDYWVNLELYKNKISPSGNWFSYLGKSAKLDTWELWAAIGKYGRLAVRLLICGGAMYYFWK